MLQDRLVVLVLRDVPVIPDLQDSPDLGVEPDQLAPLEPQEIQVTLDHLDQAVPLDRLETRDRPDHPVQLVLLASLVQQGQPV